MLLFMLSTSGNVMDRNAKSLFEVSENKDVTFIINIHRPDHPLNSIC